MCSDCPTEPAAAARQRRIDLSAVSPTAWIILTLTLLAAGATDAETVEPSRFYGSVGLGWSYAEPFIVDGTNAVIDYDFNASVGLLAVGMRAFDGWRFELEASHQHNAPEVLYFRGSDVELDTRGDDRLRASSLMLGAYRDFQAGGAFRPYLGAGLGAAWVDLTFTEYDPVTEAADPLIDDQVWTLAYQVLAGVTVPLGRHLDLGVEYRYWRAPDVELESLTGDAVEGSQSIHSGWLRLNWQPGGYHRADSPARPDGPRSGFYVRGTVGGSWAPDRDFVGMQGQFDAFDIGPLVSLAAGYQWSGHWRLGVDVARLKNGMEIYDTRVEETRTKGSVVATTLAADVGYRFRPGRSLDPFVGVGIGAASIRYGLDVAAGRSPLIRDTDRAGMVQWQLGVNIGLSDRWTVITGYRGLLTDHVTLKRTDGDTIRTTYLAHAMTIGALYRF